MAAPAQPMLASILYATHVTTASKKRRKLRSGCQSIDDMLKGGLCYGVESGLCCISGEEGSGGKEISQALLVEHLSSSSTTKATLIDTTLSFDVRRFRNAIVTSLAHDQNATETATSALSRLKIMKTFDFVGLTEGIAEVRDSLEDPDPGPKATIGDSESEDEMLDDPKQHPADTHGLLLIDNLTQVAAPLLKNDNTAGQALLASFMRSLGHLSRAHSLCTVILNGTTTYTSPSSSDAPSIFSSCTVRPALGRTLPFLVDLHLLVHKQPRTIEGARMVYGDGCAGREPVEWVRVVEVLQDRYSDRVGRWAPFVVHEDGRLVDVP